jgi:hypothetical protein
LTRLGGEETRGEAESGDEEETVFAVHTVFYVLRC